MRLSKSFVFLFILFFLQLNAQDKKDSLVLFGDLRFKSDFEKNVFRQYATNPVKPDLIDLFFTPYVSKEMPLSSSAHTLVKECADELKKKTAEMNETKKIKTIYKDLHQRFFKVYKLQNSFADIFEKGEYNCVSASALYAIVLEDLNIPYHVMEAPKHVYLMAYPGTSNILIESTDPRTGYFAFSSAYIEKFVKFMYGSKLITKEEYESNSAESLFNKYYFEKKALGIRDLAAIQYVNYAVYASDEKNYSQALDEVKKAYYLSPIERNRYILESLLTYMVTNSDYKQGKDIDNFVMLCRFNHLSNKDVSDEKIKYEFSRITETQLIERSDYTGYDSSCKRIFSSLADTSLRNELEFRYHYELARLGFINLKGKDYEMPHLQKAYHIKPDHANLQSITIAYFAKLTESENDPEKILKEMDNFSKSFDFLEKNEQFRTLRANCYLEKAYQFWLLKDAANGDSYLKKFETYCTPGGEIKTGEKYIEKAYSTAASYYYTKGDAARSRQLLKTGLHYAPDNFGLKVRLSQIQK
jgi:hypothetical protein